MYGGEQAAFSLYENCASLAFTTPVSGLTETFMHREMGAQEIVRTSTSEQNGGGGFSESSSHTVTAVKPVSSSAFATLGGPSKRNGVPVIARGGKEQSVWWSGRVPPAFVKRFLRPVDPRLVELSKRRRPASFLAPRPFTVEDHARLGIPYPPPTLDGTTLFGVPVAPYDPTPPTPF